MSKKYLISFLAFLICSTAWGASLTFNGGDWNDTANWTGWVVATSADDVTTAANVSSNSGAPATVRTLTVQGNGVLNIDLTASDGATFNGYAYHYAWTLTANTTFNNTSHNHTLIVGTTTFNESSFNSGPITGDVTFTGATENNSTGEITGNVTFSSTSRNVNGPITGNIIFNSSNSNTGTITGNAVFNNGLNRGNISGTATFNNSTQNQSIVTGLATFNNSSKNVGSANGGAIFNADSQNYGGFVRGDSYFYDNADNRGTIATGTANFYNFTTNYNNINTSVIFNDFSFNEGHIVGGATFNDTSYNNNDITGNVIFTENSYNAALNGEIIGNADVYYPSANPIGGTVTGTVTYHNYPESIAPVLSQTTAVPSSTNDTTPAYTFTTNEAGAITYGGSCSSATTSATVGANTISFNTLTEGTYSNCTITVTDSWSNVSSALAVTAFTVDTTGPVISAINSAILYPPGAAITWTTNEGATSRVEYGLTDSYGTLTTLDSSPMTAHTVNITGLSQVTTYHYRVISVDAVGNSRTSADNTFTTSGVGSGGGGGGIIQEDKKEAKAERKDEKQWEKETKGEEKTEKKAEKEQVQDDKKDKKNVKAEVLSESPLYEPFATRERTLSIALKLSGIEITGIYICQNKFTDTSTPYSCEVAEKSQEAGLISRERTTFRPTRSVTRVEAYAIFMKSACVAPETNENNWQKLIIKKAIELGFTSRTIDTFRPDRAISTPEMFALARQIGEWKTNNPDSCQNK